MASIEIRDRRRTLRYRNLVVRQVVALLREKEIQRGNKNRATLAVARKLVTYILAVNRRKQDFVPAEELAAKAVA